MSCENCGVQFEGKGGPGGHVAVIFPCICKVCNVCALKQEAEAQQQQPEAAGGGGKKKSKGKGKGKAEVRKPTPCPICKWPCNTPVDDLLLDLVMLKSLDGSSGTAALLCDACEEAQPTKHCDDCLKTKLFCDDCYTATHRSTKKQGHTTVSYKEHLASATATADAGGFAAAQDLCTTHKSKPLDVFCVDCGLLVCAMCAVKHHKTHTLQPVEEAAAVQRAEIETAVASTTVSYTKANDAIQSLQQLKADLISEKDNSIKTIVARYRKVSAASLTQSKAYCKEVEEAYKEKTDAVDVQIYALETAGTRSEEAVALAQATLEMATSEQVLQVKEMFVGGLARLTGHEVATEPCRSSKIEAKVSELFDIAIAQMSELMVLNVGNTNPAKSTAFGEGIVNAFVGDRAEFVVTAIEFGTGTQRAGGGDIVTVRLVPKDKVDEDRGGSDEGGGGGGGAAATPAKGGKRKRGGSGSAVSVSKKSKTGAASSASSIATQDLKDAVGDVVDNGDGSYNCSYELPDGAEEKDWELKVRINGEHVVGGPFAIEVMLASLGGIKITGATGGHAANVNGIFEKTEEMQNGKPVYMKVDSSMVCCWYSSSDKWFVGLIKDKDANKIRGWACSTEKGLAAPELATEWKVVVNSEYVRQRAVTGVALSSAEVHAAKSAADAAAAVALAASGFTITGATGKNAHFVNGTFTKTDEIQNGKQVYSKDDDVDMWCYYNRGGRWYVTDTADKDANKNDGWACSVEIKVAAPQLATAWKVFVNGKHTFQPAVKLTNT